MKAAGLLLGLVLILDVTFAAEESCVGGCGSFESQRKCQCDTMCIYYGSCCSDFYTVCPKRTRGDTFAETEDVTEIMPSSTSFTPTFPTTVKPTVPASPTRSTNSAPPPSVDPNAAPCSGQPFDAFLQLKNGSIYAFRGEYFFELDDISILPGYPKLIQDVWGISGPISAAFTRINCQGKTYIFKGNQYWRFEGDVLDEDYPRDISVGFDGIPDDVDAAFAVPAPSHRGKEKAFFFKGDKYYQYEFKHQPSHGECVQMSRSSPSVLFSQYTDVYCDDTFEGLFQGLFGGSLPGSNMGPRLISRDWQGIKPPIDAAMVGRIHLTPKPTPSPPLTARRRSSRRRRPSRRQRGRQTRSLFDDLFSLDDLFDFTDIFEESTMQDHKSTPVQNVYFFQRDKYYRASLQSKRVAAVNPPYPRSIAKYWLGCEQEDKPDTSRAEKR